MSLRSRAAVLLLLLLPSGAWSQTDITLSDSQRSTSYQEALVTGDHLYVWDSVYSLDLYDVADPTDPRRVQRILPEDPAYFSDPIQLTGALCYVEVDGQTHLYDFSLPASPTDLGAIGVDLRGCLYSYWNHSYDPGTQTLYGVCIFEEPHVLSAFDVSTPQAPVLLWQSTLPIAQEDYGIHVVVRGPYAYVTWASYYHDFQQNQIVYETWFGRFDLTDPGAPISLGATRLTNGGYQNSSIVIVDDTLFVTGGNLLLSYAFGMDGAVGALDQLAFAGAVDIEAVRGNELLLRRSSSRLVLVDASVPDPLAVDCEADLSGVTGYITHVATDDDNVFLTRGASGLYVHAFDCVGPFAELAAVPVFATPEHMVTVGDHAFVQALDALWSVEMGYDGRIELLDRVETDDGTLIGVESGYVLQRVPTSSLKVFDVRDPEAMIWIATHAMGTGVYDGAARGSLVALRTGGGSPLAVRLYDFSDPQEPQLLGQADLPPSIFDVNSFTNMTLTEDAVYMAYRDVVVVVDASDPAHPAYAGTVTVPTAITTRFLLDVRAGHLLTSNYREHRVWSLADPTNPAELSVLPIPRDGYYRFTTMGNLLLGVGSSVVAFDFRNPAAPVHLADTQTASDGEAILRRGNSILLMHSTAIVSFTVSSPTVTPASSVPLQILDQNHPNPFGHETVIRLRSRPMGAYDLKVYDVAGRLVRRWQGRLAPSEFHWDGRDQDGRPVASGVYYYRFSTGEVTESRRMVLRR